MLGRRMSAVFSISATRRIWVRRTRGSVRDQRTHGRATTDLDRSEAGTVAGGHVLVAGVHGVRAGQLAELLVHVVRSGARVVTEPDAEVLDLQRLLLRDLGRVQESQWARRCWEEGATTRTTLTATTSPVVFLTLRSLRRKYQKRDFATTSLGAKMRMR